MEPHTFYVQLHCSNWLDSQFCSNDIRTDRPLPLLQKAQLERGQEAGVLSTFWDVMKHPRCGNTAPNAHTVCNVCLRAGNTLAPRKVYRPVVGSHRETRSGGWASLAKSAAFLVEIIAMCLLRRVRVNRCQAPSASAYKCVISYQVDGTRISWLDSFGATSQHEALYPLFSCSHSLRQQNKSKAFDSTYCVRKWFSDRNG